MTRVLQSELLDELPASDPRAVHSRRDLRRINTLMGNARAIIKFVTNHTARLQPKATMTLAEIGAGEGLVGAQLARALSAQGFSGKLLLVDQQPLFAGEIAGWKTRAIKSDIFKWLDGAPHVDVIVSNLFLHHFTDSQLSTMLACCAERCDCFAAAEPHRSTLAAWFSRRVNLIGCNEVTRHDAEISVRAGFDGAELSAIWPRDDSWRLTEKRVGAFTHFFGAAHRT